MYPAAANKSANLGKIGNFVGLVGKPGLVPK
jgi:hypothetical protein